MAKEIPGPKLDRPSREQYKQGLNEIFSGSIGDGLELDMRAETALTNIGINTIGELVQYTKTYLREIKKVSPRVLERVEENLMRRGLRLGMTEKEMYEWMPPSQ